jgi:hypothetical protein
MTNETEQLTVVANSLQIILDLQADLKACEMARLAFEDRVNVLTQLLNIQGASSTSVAAGLNAPLVN